MLGAAGAALLHLDRSGHARQAALVNGAVSTTGIGAGALVSSLLVQFVPAQRVVPFLVVAVWIVLLLAIVRALPEPVPVRARPSLRPQRPAVPARTRSAFALAALGVLSSWSIGGLYLALGPKLATHLLNTHGELAGGLAVAALGAPAGLAQLADAASPTGR